MERLHLRHLSTGEPTYWPSDNNKLPDLVSLRVSLQPLLQQRLASIYRQTTPRSWLSPQTTRCHQWNNHTLAIDRPTGIYFATLSLNASPLKSHLKLLKTYKRRSSSPMIPSNGPHPTLQPHSTPTAALPSSGNDWTKNDSSARDGSTQEHQKTRDYSTELHGNSGMCRTITSIGTSKWLPSKKKSSAQATNITLVSPHIQMTKY
jgi:hypothetical protein